MPTSTHPFTNLIKAAWEAIASEHVRFFAFVALFILATITDLALPWVIGSILQSFENGGITDETFRVATMGIAGYIALRLLNTIFHHTARYIQNTVTYVARMHVLEKIFNTFLKFPIGWHVKHHSGENLSRLYRSAGAVESTVGTYVWQVVEGVVKVGFAAAALFMLDFKVASCVFSMSVITIGVIIFFNKRLTNRIRKNFGFANKINRICVDYLANIITVKTLGLESAASKYLANQTMEGLSLSKKISKYSELKWCATSVGHAFITGSSLFVYFLSHKNTPGSFQIGQVYVLLSYLDRIFAAIGSFTGYYGGLIEAATGYEDATKLKEEALELAAQNITAHSISNWQSISISNLNFSYESAERVGLDNFTVKLNREDKVALVGPSGGGKSTFLKVLAGLLTPDSCTINIETKKSDSTGITTPPLVTTTSQSNASATTANIIDINQATLLVPQEPEIFSETLRFNLTMGDNFSDETLQYFVQLCRVDSVLKKLANGWDTDLAEKGLNLSVGEKQRVTIARGLLRAQKKEFLLLDEPTSSLDPKTEKQVFINLLNHFHDRTILTACHRLNLVPLFNKIIYIQQGKIEEVGSFDELLAKGGYFAKAWEEYQKKIGGGG